MRTEEFFRRAGFMFGILSARFVESGLVTSGTTFGAFLFGQSFFDRKCDLVVFLINGKHFYFYNIVHFNVVIDVLYKAVGYL